jgi:predicted CXXCH cytochrome family protein
VVKKHKTNPVKPPAGIPVARAAAERSITRRALWSALVIGLILLAASAWIASRSGSAPAVPAAALHDAAAVTADFVGSDACASCHGTQHAAWKGSQHARAMQHATADTVLGDFNDAKYSRDGVTSEFFRRDGKYFVRTDGPDGKLADFEVRYTFGLEPLQQYLVELPGGRLQALAVTWDTRAERDGGQRWFRQYPDEKLDFRDELHWTRRSQNWNVMCADCHSTNVRKEYDATAGTFATQYSEMTVGCESCHGPGSSHVAWAETKPAADATKGLTVALDERRGASWQIDAASGNARRSPERRTARETDVCAQCHSRRAQLAEGYRAGLPFMDHYLPSLLSAGLYHADGQQLDEVFTWGSFLQSRMHRAGVTCSDCHDPHTQKLRAPGNAVCGQCHQSTRYDTKDHHFHPPSSLAGQCVNCHMPATTYMVVDPRRDHSFRVPRPDLTVAIGTPNACSGCHRESTPRWAADAVAKWYGPQRRNEPHYGEALDAAQRTKPGAARGLIAVVGDPDQPAIVRATAIAMLPQYPGRAADEAVRRALRDADPLVRHAAVAAHEAMPAEQAAAPLAPLLGDPSRAVRIEAARLIASVAEGLGAEHKRAYDAAIAEFEAVQRGNLHGPEAWMNLGNLHARRGDIARAEEAYREALRREPAFVPAYVNLADLRRAEQRDDAAEALLRDGLRAAPGAAALHEALGLALVRQGDKRAALVEFAAAHKAAPAESRYAYVYAVALHGAGRRPEAIRVLTESAKRGGGRDVLLALAIFKRQGGDEAGAGEALRALAAINPDDPALAQFRTDQPRAPR